MREFIVEGLLITPFLRSALLAALIMVVLRFVLIRLRFYRYFWHPLLAEAAIYICLVAVLNLSA